MEDWHSFKRNNAYLATRLDHSDERQLPSLDEGIKSAKKEGCKFVIVGLPEEVKNYIKSKTDNVVEVTKPTMFPNIRIIVDCPFLVLLVLLNLLQIQGSFWSALSTIPMTMFLP